MDSRVDNLPNMDHQGTGWFRSQRHMATVAMLWGLVNFRDFYPGNIGTGFHTTGKRNCPKVS